MQHPPLASGRLVALYGTGGLVGAAASVAVLFVVPWLGALMAWGAGSLLVLAGLYVRAASGEDAARGMRHGATAGLYRAVLLPYRLLQYTWIVVRRAQVGEPAMQAVGARIVLGGRSLWWDCPSVARLGIDASVDLCAELPEAPCVRARIGDRYHAAPALDGGAPQDATFDEAVSRAVEWARGGHTVLVHCALGHGRSALVAAAALVELGEAPDVTHALAALRAQRPAVNVDSVQRAALDRWAERRSRI